MLPPGHSIRIELNPEKGPLFATVTVYRGEKWLGEASMAPEDMEYPGSLQEFVDLLTKRGVRAT